MKKTLALIGIGAAFLAVSLWVWLSRGRNAKAVKAKFRLGGMILTLTGIMAAGCTPGSGTTCYEPPIECYDPAPINVVHIEGYSYNHIPEVANGEQLSIKAYYMTFKYVGAALLNADKEVLQTEIYTLDGSQGEFIFTVEAGGYRGAANLVIWMSDEDVAVEDFSNLYYYDHPMNIIDGTQE
jgi:hypothetical protein